MFVQSISIRRQGDYYGSYGKPDPSKPFEASVVVHGQHGKVELNLSPDLSRRIIDIIADEVVAAGRATAEAMTASVFDTKALPKKATAA